jgi:glycine cleavage system regulatory protein
MYTFVRAQAIAEGKLLYIPLYMRAMLAIHNKSDLWVSIGQTPERDKNNQIVISQIRPEMRRDIWNIRVSFRDRSGLLFELTQLLREQKINILHSPAITRDRNNEFVVDLEIDAGLYTSEFDYDSGTREKYRSIWLEELYTRIIVKFIADIKFRTDGKPNIYVRRNNLLADSIKSDVFIERCRLQDGFVTLPKNFIENIRSAVADYPRAGDTPYALLSADPLYDNLMAYVYFESTGHAHVRVTCLNRPGTIADVTSEFTRAGLNILQLFSREVDGGANSLIDILVKLPFDLDTKKDQTELEKWIKGFEKRESFKDLSCEIKFPEILTPEQITLDQQR